MSAVTVRGLSKSYGAHEVKLSAGDTVVNRGGNHAWSNRSNAPCKVAFILIDGKYDAGLAARFKEAK